MPQLQIDQNQRSNLLQTLLLLMAMSAILSGTGFILFGYWGFISALLLLLIGVVFSSRISAAMVLRMYKAVLIEPHQAPQLISLFHVLSERAELPKPPRLYYVPTALPNAFAVGVGKNAAVAITDGLLKLLTQRELAGVLAHELAHIVHHDIRVLGLADTISRTTSFLSRMGLLMVLFSFGSFMIGSNGGSLIIAGLTLFFAPTLVILLQLAVSRTREFNADQGAAEITGDPLGLAMALQKLDIPEHRGVIERLMSPGNHRKEPAMLRTHPPTAERVEKLMELVRISQAENHAGPMLEPPESLLPKMVYPPIRKPRYHVISGVWR